MTIKQDLEWKEIDELSSLGFGIPNISGKQELSDWIGILQQHIAQKSKLL